MKRIVTLQDISCVGQCSLTVALPILSACGIETCVLPSAVLSTHTGGFSGWTFRDLTDDMPAIAAHCVWAQDEDFALLAEKGVTVATCPKSNLKLTLMTSQEMRAYCQELLNTMLV